MLKENIVVDICIATYRRPDGIKKLLQSLVNQKLDCNQNINLIIVDNDPLKSAQEPVESFLKDKGVPFVYDVQPEKNIAKTRNKCLEHSHSEYIAFIDDDEWAPPHWLRTLLKSIEEYEADIVFGAVLPEFPENTPAWIIKGRYFESQGITGKILTDGASNNALIKATKKIRQLLKFDPDYGLTGGSDTELFYRLHVNGAKLIWCNEAYVYETIPIDRMAVKWLMKRSFRCGQSYARIFNKNNSVAYGLFYLSKRLVYLSIVLLALPPALLMGKIGLIWVLRKAASNAGQISVELTNKTFKEYR